MEEGPLDLLNNIFSYNRNCIWRTHWSKSLLPNATSTRRSHGPTHKRK